MTQQSTAIPNHPAWMIGHLCHSLQAIGGELGLQPWLPDDWPQNFGTGSTPINDPVAYPTKPELLKAFQDAQSRIDHVLNNMTQKDWKTPLPDLHYRSTFPTVGHAVLYTLVAHMSIHIDQLNIWRRTNGFKPIPELILPTP